MRGGDERREGMRGGDERRGWQEEGRRGRVGSGEGGIQNETTYKFCLFCLEGLGFRV